MRLIRLSVTADHSKVWTTIVVAAEHIIALEINRHANVTKTIVHTAAANNAYPHGIPVAETVDEIEQRIATAQPI
jgi:hypothetical protein